MYKMSQANIDRGKKWNAVLELVKFRKDNASEEWLNSQPSIVEDIKEYLDSLKKETKSKGKK